MPGDPHDSSLTRVQPFFTRLLTQDASGRSWLSALLAASPHGRERLGELVHAPGWLVTPLAVPTVNGRLACFDFPVAPSRELLAWFIDHPGELVWPGDSELSRESTILRRALLRDDPPGSQERAQERARQLLAARTPLSQEWWRFEGIAKPDCVLITDRLVITVEGKRTESLACATNWYPARSELVRTMEAARELAQDKRWASLLLTEEPLAEGTDEHLKRALSQAAPHLDAAGGEELRTSYLGNLTWREACAAVGIPFESLPEATDELAEAAGS